MRFAILVLASAFAGCAVGPDYQRPKLDVPATLRGDESAAPGSVADMGWWDLYGDAKLRALISAALRNSPDVNAAVARVDEARAARGETVLGLLPTVTGNGAIARSKRSTDVLLPGARRLSNMESASVGVSYELDFWGRLRRTNEAARANLLGTEYARRAVSVSLVAAVATRYFTLLTLDSQLEITHRTVATRAKFVELTRAQHERGYATGLDVATAAAQEAAARTIVPDLERRIGESENQLCVLLGENPHPIDRERHGETMPAAPPMPPPGLPSALLERRPDVRAAEEALRAANANIGIARAALFPTISLTGLAGSLSSPLGALFKSSTAEWSVAAGLVQPLLDSQRSIYQVEVASARKRVALFQYSKAVQTAFQESADAILEYQKYGEFEREQATQVDAQRRAAAIALARYRVGYASYFDVINADRDLFTAELGLSQADANRLTSLVRLYQVLGGGWQDPPPS